jgi:Flp pilus assembly protein TadD
VKSTETKTHPSGPTSKEQTQIFDKAMAYFHKRDYGKALDAFQKVTEGPVPEISHTALMHIRICQRQLGAASPNLKTPDDFYNFGIALMNKGDLQNASSHLRKAVSGNASADHYHYALALCSAILGDLESSAEHLRKAIALSPQNRVAARNDADFQALANRSPIREVLYPERSIAAR